jgi:hypothetical protein
MHPAGEGAATPVRGAFAGARAWARSEVPILAGVGAALVFAALFFAGGDSDDRLVWIGGAAILVAAVAGGAVALRVASSPRLETPALVFVGCLAGLAVLAGASVAWSIEPDASWAFTNRTLVYLAFACVGLLLGRVAPTRIAGGLAALLGLVFAWALAGKVIPGLAPPGGIARLRAPVVYWNSLALLGDAAVVLALWLAAPARRRTAFRVAGVVLLYAALVGILLTYSRVGVTLAVLGAGLWVLLERDRVASLVAAAVAVPPAVGVFLWALALPGITDADQSHARRVADGWRFGLVLVAGALLAAGAALVLARRQAREPIAASTEHRVSRIAAGAAVLALVAGIVVAGVRADTLWHDFATSAQVPNTTVRLSTVNSGNRWTWWKEAWHGFTAHPLGGIGAGSFGRWDRYVHRSTVRATDPHNAALQFLSELGILGLLLFVGAAAAAVVGVSRARARSGPGERPAVTALALGLLVWLLHLLVDMDWRFLAVEAPFFVVAGALLGSPGPAAVRRESPRRLLLAAATGAFALVAVYSLAAPWLGRREVDKGLSPTLSAAVAADHFRRARTYDPLSVDPLTYWAAVEAGAGNLASARDLLRKALSIEPRNADTWYQLGDMELWQGHRFVDAYVALNNSYTWDEFGPAAVRCGDLDVARQLVGRAGPKCPRQVRAARRAAGLGAARPTAPSPPPAAGG